MKNTELAKKIKELRGRKGMSQEELAEKSQLSLRTVQRIEGGETEPRGDTLQRLASALGTTPDELIDWTEADDKGFLAALKYPKSILQTCNSFFKIGSNPNSLPEYYLSII